MSGHSKWSTIKRKKAATDAARGKAFTRIIKEITLAARAGGDPDGNPRLRTAIQAAKAVNMPAANIERAVRKGTGELDGATIEEMHFEGYGPHGVAILVECATDNRNRAANDIRHLFTRFGGSLAAAGAVSYLFRTRGVIVVDRAAIAEDALLELALEAGAEDVVAEGATFEVLTPPSAFESVREALAARSVAMSSAEVTRLASIHVTLTEQGAGSVLRLIEQLEENDDVQKVYANFLLPDEVLAKLTQ
ncbi:MAG: YebC/PmpR family DNA-binding transcriptional regulator [Candidatus Eisenbacteria bacterium]|nr:YebC/PmpR family DNA-binding transcriptional regulator [Candidatus Eisenbacteria bacterium]